MPNKKVNIRQNDLTDCGAACIASVCSNYKHYISIAKIRQLASTDKKGTNILGMIEALEKLGFSAKGVKGEYDSLFQIPKPAILHIIVENILHHYVVFYKVTKKYIFYMDPAYGKMIKKNHADFKKEWTGIMILTAPGNKFRPVKKDNSLIKRFLSLILPHKSVMFQAFIGAVVYSILGLSTSVYMKNIIDHVLIDGNNNLLILMSILMIVILFLKIYINLVKSFLALKTGQKIDTCLVLGYYKHLLYLPQRFFDTMRIGEIISRVSDAGKIRAFINNASIDIMVSFLMVVFTICCMFIFSWKLALVISTTIPLYFLVYGIFNKFNKYFLRRLMEKSADLESHLVESLKGISTIKQFGNEYFSNIELESRFIQFLKTAYRTGKFNFSTHGLLEFIAGGLTIGLLWFGSKLVLSQEISQGMLISFYSLLSYFLSPMGQLVNSNQVIQDAIIAADRLFQIIDLETEDETQGSIQINNQEFDLIRFENVSFRYGSRIQVFDNLNMNIHAGKTTAIVGESGSGKTTIAALIQRLYPLKSGAIKIGNYSLEHISYESLRQFIGIVPQNIELFSGNIIENIALGEFDPDLKRVIDVCDLINIRSLIEDLPNGFYTILGEQGISLSGGERQRIAIARAMYHNPEILILDEATSSLDPYSEDFIIKAMDHMKNNNKTIIIITHKLSNIKHADNICVLKKGKLVEQGNHHCLIKKKSYYYDMWIQQMPALKEFIK